MIVAISSSRRLRPIGVFAVHAGIGSILIALKGIHTLAVIMIVVLVSTRRGSHGGCGRDPTAVAARHDGVCCLSLSMFSVYLWYCICLFQHCIFSIVAMLIFHPCWIVLCVLLHACVFENTVFTKRRLMEASFENIRLFPWTHITTKISCARLKDLKHNNTVY